MDLLDFGSINIENIQIKRSSNNFIDIVYNGGPLVFWTPKIFIPFGYEEKFNSYFINFELFDYNNNIELQIFLSVLLKIEEKIIELLGIENHQLNSQIRHHDLENPILYTKIIERNKKIITIVRNDKNEFLNFYKLEKQHFSKNKLVIDKIWCKNNKYYLKYKVKEMIYYE
jgi:hypothetical protein